MGSRFGWSDDSSSFSAADIKNLDATKIATGQVTNAKFNYLSNLSGDIQTSLNSKLDYTNGSINVNSNVVCNLISANVFNTSGSINVGANVVCNAIISNNFQVRYYKVPANDFISFTPDNGVNTYMAIQGSTNSILCNIPLYHSGLSVTNSSILDISIPPNGEIQGITYSTSTIKLSTANTARCITKINYSGSLLPYQKVTLHNNTGYEIHVADKVFGQPGDILCYPNTILESHNCLLLVWNSDKSKWMVANQNFSTLDRTVCLRWANDINLLTKISSTKTYRFAYNFCGSGNSSDNVTVHGVTFDNVRNTASEANVVLSGVTYTNTSIMVRGTSSFYTATLATELTDTQSTKLKYFSYAFSAYDFTFTTNPQYIYEFVVLNMCTDGNKRYGALVDLCVTNTPIVTRYMTINEYIDPSAPTAANQNGNMNSYVFRAKYTTTTIRVHNIDTPLSFHLYAVACIEHGLNLNT